MFEWKSEYSLQIPQMDAQHQRLFSLASELHAAMANRQGAAVAEQALATLIEYTRTHFSAEEGLMRHHSFPESVSHKQEHDKLTAQVLDFQKRLARKESWLTVDLMLFLQNWLTRHICISDRKYAEHIHKKAAA